MYLNKCIFGFKELYDVYLYFLGFGKWNLPET